MIWITPANGEIYEHAGAFKKYGFIDWKQGVKYNIGDIVYIYCTQPIKRILYKCEIIEINKDFKNCVDDREFWKSIQDYEQGKKGKYARLKLLSMLNTSSLSLDNLKNNGLKSAPQGPMRASEKLAQYLDGIFNTDSIMFENPDKMDEKINEKRINTKQDWLDILNNENQEKNIVLETLFYMMGCKNHLSNGRNIARALGGTKFPNLDFVHFGQRIIKLKKIPEQHGDRGKYRYWNIPFTTDIKKNKETGVFTWRIRDELAEALIEKYRLFDKKEITAEEQFENYLKINPVKQYEMQIAEDVETRDSFVNKFNTKYLINMELKDYATGRLSIDENGKNSFCYLLEFGMMRLGDMRGGTSKEYGVWYSKEEKKYKSVKKYGDSVEECFQKIKEELCKLLIAGSKEDYTSISQSLLSPLVRGKILSTYFPEKYICIFKEEDIDNFLNILDIDYDIHTIDTLEKKMHLLKEYKNEHKLFQKYSDYYFVKFLYDTYNQELKTKHTINGEIDYQIELVDFKYLGTHKKKNKLRYRDRETDYEKINRNKKDIGNRGEKAILKYEKNNLLSLGLNELAQKVELTENDALGYDIISYTETGEEKHIEVKTTSGNSDKILDFYLTDNELQKMKLDSNYYIYYLFDIKNKPKLHIINKEALLNHEKDYLMPVAYKIMIDVQKNDPI